MNCKGWRFKTVMMHVEHQATGKFIQRNAAISFVDVSKSFDGIHKIVSGLNLDIQDSEFLTMLGPSGSGKTTSLMMLAGFEVPTGGEIFLDGAPLSRLPPHKRNIGMVFQNYALFPHLTIAENIAFPLQVRGKSRSDIEKSVARALDMVRLPHVGDRRPSQLSGGQQQRVALARALVFEPRLVLMDEPLGALDKQLREHMQYEIRSLHARLGITVVYVTHDQTEALTMSDRVAVFSHGRVRQLAPPKEMYEEPANAFVARFVGESNAFRGRITEPQGKHAIFELEQGGALTVTPIDCAGRGPALVVVRPEHVLVGAAASERENRLIGQVEDVVYHGDHLQVHLAYRDVAVVAKIGKQGVDLPVPGTETAFAFLPQHARAYDPETAEA